MWSIAGSHGSREQVPVRSSESAPNARLRGTNRRMFNEARTVSWWMKGKVFGIVRDGGSRDGDGLAGFRTEQLDPPGFPLPPPVRARWADLEDGAADEAGVGPFVCDIPGRRHPKAKA